MLLRCVISSGGQGLDHEVLAQAAGDRLIRWSSTGFKISTCGLRGEAAETLFSGIVDKSGPIV
jgi:hypothetical protein